MSTLFCDIESYSTIPISAGSYKYAEGAEVIIWTYALDDGDVKLWDLTLTQDMPKDLKEAIDTLENSIVFHNGGNFDRVVIEKALGIRIPPERIHDTLARAFSHGLPGGLDILCDIMQVPISKAKDKDGKKLISMFCMPKKYPGPNIPRKNFLNDAAFQKYLKEDQEEWELGGKNRLTRKTNPLEWDRFCNYAKLDIEAMRYIYKNLPLWNYTGEELKLWHLDQLINERGIAIDLDLANAAIRAVERAQKKLAARTDELTLGDVASTTQRDQLLRHILQAYGIELPDLQASTLEHRIEDPELPIEVKELLQIRLQASSTSTAKYSKFLKNVSSDGRLRGTLQFSGAARTKRASARGVQLQNLSRPTLPARDIDFGIEAMKADCEDMFFDNVMELASNAVRGCLLPSEGKKLVISDLSNIEGRIVAWLAGEESKIEAFRAFDKGIGPDLYKLAYSKAFRMDPKDVNKLQRQIGKVMELMLGYQSGVHGFITGAANYGIDLEDMAAKVLSELPQDVLDEARGMWEWAVKEEHTFDLKEHVFVACDSLKRLWRRTHPNIVNLWNEMGVAAVEAIETKDKLIKCRKLGFIRSGNWLRMVLPSGYFLCYPAPKVDNEGVVSYMGMNNYSRKWGRIKTYAGKWVENASQATARDAMMWRLQPIEDAGYNILLHVHDEIISEAPDNNNYTAEKLSQLLATNPPWATGLPLAAGGFESARYKKAE